MKLLWLCRGKHQPWFLMSGFSIRNSSEPQLYVVHPYFIIEWSSNKLVSREVSLTPYLYEAQESQHESGTFNGRLDISEYIGITVLLVSWFAKFMFYSGSWACFYLVCESCLLHYRIDNQHLRLCFSPQVTATLTVSLQMPAAIRRLAPDWYSGVAHRQQRRLWEWRNCCTILVRLTLFSPLAAFFLAPADLRQANYCDQTPQARASIC